MTLLFRKLLSLNWLMLLTVAGLCLFGVHAIGVAVADNPVEAIARAPRSQAIWLGVGVVVFFIACFIDYRFLRWLALPAFLVGVAMLVWSLAAGEVINDSQRWVSIGGFSFQPAQFAIVASIIATSAALAGFRRAHPFWRLPFVRLGLVGLLLGLPVLLVVAQGDIGTALACMPVGAALCLVGRIPLRHLALVALAVATVLPPAYHFGLNDARRSRIEVYFDMLQGREVDIQGSAYAAYYTSTAVGSGGWNGYQNTPQNAAAAEGGLEGVSPPPRPSIHEQGLIPRLTAHNDFIFAVIAERYGFRGSALLLGAFALLIGQCLFIAFSSRDLFGTLLAVGCATMIFAHVFQNVGMTLLLTPITGLPLPFISYGGTFLVAMLGMMGVCQSVWVHRIDHDRDPLLSPEEEGYDAFENRRPLVRA